MNLTNESILNRLSELLLSEVNNPIEQLQTEIKEAKTEVEKRYKEQAANNIYRLQRVQVRRVYNSFSDSYSNVEEMIQGVEIRYADLAAFANQHKMDVTHLQAVAESREKEIVSGSDKSLWRAWPFRWTDTNRNKAENTDMQIEQADFAARIERKNKRAKEAQETNKVTAPTLEKFLSIEPIAAEKR